MNSCRHVRLTVELEGGQAIPVCAPQNFSIGGVEQFAVHPGSVGVSAKHFEVLQIMTGGTGGVDVMEQLIQLGYIEESGRLPVSKSNT
jgi:hypothetical protein